MTFQIIDVDETEVIQKWHVNTLSGKLIAQSQLQDALIYDMLHPDTNLSISKADCVIQACQRILQAKQNKEKVFVGGDYDADGICSCAIMKKTLDVLGIENGYYIPDRFLEGYGLSKKTVHLAYQKGYTLIITVDNGVKAHEALQEAKRLGMDVIVTDHHQIDEAIEADIVVHPDYMESEYAYLSGAGVALELSRNLIGTGSQYDNLVALCCVALIGDVMPLWKETRKIVQRGLSILKQGRVRPLSILFYPGCTIDETAVAFNIVPKLNAVGRMHDVGNVNTLIPYLLSTDETVITKYAQQLNAVNEKRKQLSKQESEQATKHVDDAIIQVIYEENFHEGICGLVAGKLANTYNKPFIVMAKSDTLIKGSGRSIVGFNLFEFFRDFEEMYAFGGHEMAVGISVKQEQWQDFIHHIHQKAKTIQLPEVKQSKQAIRIQCKDVTFDTVLDIERLSPYPKDMVEPFFALEDVQIIDSKETAKTIRYTIANGTQPIQAIIYKWKNINNTTNVRGFIGKLQINHFRGTINLQMVVEETLT